MNLVEALSYSFIRRALFAGLAVGLSSGVLGLFLVLRRYSSIGDGLAHVGLAAVAVGLMAGIAPIYVAAPLTVLASIWILSLTGRTGLFGETAVALVSSLAAALAVLLAGMGGGFAVDLTSYLFGSILAVTDLEMWIAVGTSALVGGAVLLFRRQLFSYVYDEDYARVSGMDANMLGRLLVVLAGLSVSVGIRVVGSLLVSSMILLPPVAALQLGLGFSLTLAASAAIAGTSVLIGIALAVAFNLPAGATIVLTNFLCFGLAFLRRVRKGKSEGPDGRRADGGAACGVSG